MSPRGKTPKQPPKFRSEDDERRFWATADATDHFDWDRAEFVAFKKLRPSTKVISLRLPEGLLEEIKLLARQRDVPYQSLMKIYLATQVDRELRARSEAKPSRRKAS